MIDIAKDIFIVWLLMYASYMAAGVTLYALATLYCLIARQENWSSIEGLSNSFKTGLPLAILSFIEWFTGKDN